MEKFASKVKVIISCLTLVVLTLLLTAGSASAVWRSFAGVGCQAYNNNQADALQRSHVRLLNPSSSPTSIYVVCDVPQFGADLNTVGASNGWVYMYFSAGVTRNASCILRQFERSTVHVPGGTADSSNTINVKSVVITPPATLPGFTLDQITLNNDYTGTGAFHFYTLTCNLPPGVGIQTIRWNEQ